MPGLVARCFCAGLTLMQQMCSQGPSEGDGTQKISQYSDGNWTELFGLFIETVCKYQSCALDPITVGISLTDLKKAQHG